MAHSGGKVRPSGKSHVWDKAYLDPVSSWDRLPPIPSEAMISIKALKLTGAAILVSRGIQPLQTWSISNHR